MAQVLAAIEAPQLMRLVSVHSACARCGVGIWSSSVVVHAALIGAQMAADSLTAVEHLDRGRAEACP